jgi:putative serine protease PepD
MRRNLNMAMNRNRIAVALGVAALAGGGAGAGAVALTHGSSSSNTATTAAVSPTTNNVAASSALTVGEIAKQSSAGVVEIDSTSTGSSQSPFPNGSGSTSAEGTGFVYDSKGDIVTNAHVIDGASSVRVKFADGSTYTATVVGSDTSTDIAVLHVNAPASNLTALELGDSSSVAVGDGVVAIGNPFGLDNTVTSGIVSAVNREIAAPDNTPIEGAIQTDAAINHGNSGGPLFNLAGKVIGITSQIQSDSGGNEGVGFAIPSNTVRSIVTQLISTGKAEHALLGVSVQTGTAGVTVGSVESGSGAANGGIKSGDVITEIAGTNVTTAEKLRAIIASHKPGDNITVTVHRSGATKTLNVTLGSRS